MTDTTYPKRIHVSLRADTGLSHALARPFVGLRSVCGHDVSDWVEMRLASREEVCPDCHARMDDDPELDDDGLRLRVASAIFESTLVPQKRSYDAMEAVASLIRQKADRHQIDPALWDLEDAMDQMKAIQSKSDHAAEAIKGRFGDRNYDDWPSPIAAVLDQVQAEIARLGPRMEENRDTIDAWINETLQRRKTARAAAPRHRRHRRTR